MDDQVEEMAWALCPVFLAADQCDMPEIISGPRPKCRKCSLNGWPNGSAAGCRIVAQIAAVIAVNTLTRSA